MLHTAGEAHRAAYVIALEAKWSARMRSRPAGVLMERFERARQLAQQGSAATGGPSDCGVACRCAPLAPVPLFP
jgi:hypothetical protein